MNSVSRLKGLGYLVSIVSVLLLGIVAWHAVADEPILAACLTLGMLTSIAGMILRWVSHRREQREKREGNRPASGAAVQ